MSECKIQWKSMRNHEMMHKYFKKAGIIQINASENIEEFIGDPEYSNLSGDED